MPKVAAERPPAVEVAAFRADELLHLYEGTAGDVTAVVSYGLFAYVSPSCWATLGWDRGSWWAGRSSTSCIPRTSRTSPTLAGRPCGPPRPAWPPFACGAATAPTCGPRAS